MRKQLLCISVILLLSMSCYRGGSSDASLLRRDKPVRLELPAYSADEQVIEHIGYTTSYNSTTLNPDWVAYELTSAELQGEFKGKSSFCWDPLVKGRKSWRED